MADPEAGGRRPTSALWRVKEVQRPLCLPPCIRKSTWVVAEPRLDGSFDVWTFV